MNKKNIIQNLIIYLILFPLLINFISFLEVYFVPKEYLNNYFKYVKYVYSIVIIYEFSKNHKTLKWMSNWLKVALVLLCILNYFYAIIALLFSYFYDKLSLVDLDK